MRKLPLEQLHQPAAALVAKWKKGVEAEKPAAAVGAADAGAAEDSAKRSRSACREVLASTITSNTGYFDSNCCLRLSAPCANVL